ncbi:MAG: ParA family protein [Roseimicrobium sp.]
MPAQILSFLNFKGGVGKTTNTVNIGATLALHPQLGGKRVLVVDMDPQCNSTLWLVGREVYHWVQERDQTLHQIFRQSMARNRPDAQALIHTVEKHELSGGRLDLLPGSFSCLKLEEDPKLLDDNALGHLVLSKALDTVRSHYDFILLGLPTSVEHPHAQRLACLAPCAHPLHSGLPLARRHQVDAPTARGVC